MRSRHAAILFLSAFALSVLLEQGAAIAQAIDLPLPRRVADDDAESFSPADFERMLQRWKAEREGLKSDWLAMQKRNTPPETPIDVEQKRLQMELQRALDDLKKRRKPQRFEGSAAPESPKKSAEPDGAEDKKPDKVPPHSQGSQDKTPTPVDIIGQAHSLMRSKQYEEALATFQQVDLKGKKANERAPIQYLKACCLTHLGKAKDAYELLQEVANYRGDDQLAAYAQSQLELIRWQRDIAQRLEDIRQRHKALEANR